MSALAAVCRKRRRGRARARGGWCAGVDRRRAAGGRCRSSGASAAPERGRARAENRGAEARVGRRAAARKRTRTILAQAFATRAGQAVLAGARARRRCRARLRGRVVGSLGVQLPARRRDDDGAAGCVPVRARETRVRRLWFGGERAMDGRKVRWVWRVAGGVSVVACVLCVDGASVESADGTCTPSSESHQQLRRPTSVRSTCALYTHDFSRFDIACALL